MTGRSLWGRGACCFNYCTSLQLQSSVRTDPTRHFQSVYFIVVGYAFFKFTLTRPLRKIHTRGGKMVQWVKVPAAKPENRVQSLGPTERKARPNSSMSLWPLHTQFAFLYSFLPTKKAQTGFLNFDTLTEVSTVTWGPRVTWLNLSVISNYFYGAGDWPRPCKR